MPNKSQKTAKKPERVMYAIRRDGTVVCRGI
jgi:hypothetical protein